MTDQDPITGLLAERRVERVAANPRFVNARLKQAADNVESAKLQSASNPRAAIALAYDAMRFAFDAHMQSNGLRVANAPGAHRASVSYARTRMADLLEERDPDDYEALRTVRSRIEYPDPGTRSGIATAEADDVADCSGTYRRRDDPMVGPPLGSIATANFLKRWETTRVRFVRCTTSIASRG